MPLMFANSRLTSIKESASLEPNHHGVGVSLKMLTESRLKRMEGWC